MIVIPMAGLSSRFFKAGYTIPKYQLPLWNENVFSWVMKSFKKYFESDEFLFIVRKDFNTPEFVKNEAEKLGIKEYKIYILDRETEGQAETVYLGIEEFNDMEIYIFNIDTMRYNFVKPEWVDQCDGYLEVFEGEGDHWSFVEPIGESGVKRTTEKERISNFCSDGLYYFKSSKAFQKLFLNAKNQNIRAKGEFYIAPLYNDMIKNSLDIRFDLIDITDIDFCGTPDEYTFLLNKTIA